MVKPYYFSDDAHNLFRVDPKTLKATKIGNLGLTLTDIAVAPNGKLYGITFNDLYRINTKTAKTTLVTHLKLGGANALGFDPTGKAYIGSYLFGGIYTLNIGNGSVKQLGTDTQFMYSAGDITVHKGQLLFSTQSQEIVTVEIGTGDVLRHVHHNIFDLFGLVSDGTKVFGFANSEAYRLNVTTGKSTLARDYPSADVAKIYGAATTDFGQSGSIKHGTGSGNTLSGTSRDDVLFGAGGNDTLRGFDGNDVLIGGAGRDKLYGGKGRDVLSGDAQNDLITGGSGRDIMSGGSGADRFDFNQVSETGKSEKTRDVITDFTHNSDHIDLSTIDASTKDPGNQKFSFIATQGFNHVAGELHYFQTGFGASALTIVEGDVNGDGKADFQIELTGQKTLSSHDFIP